MLNHKLHYKIVKMLKFTKNLNKIKKINFKFKKENLIQFILSKNCK